MTPELHEKIRQVLANYLNREPSESEIINAQNDPQVMHWVNALNSVV